MIAADSPPPGVPRRSKSETLAARARENSPILAAIGTMTAAALFALAGYVQSCIAQQQAGVATAQATVAQSGQVRADVELDAAYKALADQVGVLGAAAAALAQSSRDQAERLEQLEGVVKAGLAGTAAGRKFQPGEPAAAPDVDVDEVTAQLPASPAAAAATPARRKP